jgi:hypothetical protein
MRTISTPNPLSAPEWGTIGRRVFLDLLAIGAIASVAPVPLVAAVSAREDSDARTKALYRSSADVETFYRVNRYPGNCVC